jgi:membrane-bound lytic murein transglycosylase D
MRGKSKAGTGAADVGQLDFFVALWYNYSSMKKLASTIIALFITVFLLISAAPASADVIREKSGDPEILSVHPPVAVITVADLVVEKSLAAPLVEPLIPHPAKEKPSGEKQETAVPALTPAPAVTAAIENGGPTALDTTYQSNGTALKAIERNVALFRDRMRERFSIWLERSSRYIEIMKDILKEKGLPEDLVFLPIVESGFNPNAYSRARAVGPWQFIAATGKRYGLVIDWWRDERKDPVKSTQAAAEYLKDLYKMFGSWNLALAAYNAGEGRISKALKRSDTNNYWDLLNTKQIRSETKEYVPRYIAATMIASTPEQYGFNNLEYHEPLEYDEVTLHSPLDLEVIARCSGTTLQEIRELNPELRRWSTPFNVDKYTIKIPADSKEAFDKNLANTPQDAHFTAATYTAKRGDTVKRVAKNTGMPVAAILAMNSLSGIEEIKAGYELKIPPRDKYSPDLDDRVSAKKASYKKGAGHKQAGKKGKKGSKRMIAKAKGKAKIKGA